MLLQRQLSSMIKFMYMSIDLPCTVTVMVSLMLFVSFGEFTEHVNILPLIV